MEKKIYLLERIKDSPTWRKGTRIWVEQKCKGWRVVDTQIQRIPDTGIVGDYMKNYNQYC